MTAKKKTIAKILIVFLLILATLLSVYFGIKASFPLKYTKIAKSFGLEPKLACSVMRAESGFDEEAKSRAGALGLMQLMPSTAQFICEQEKIEYLPQKMLDGAYNAYLGCAYLSYLFKRFPTEETVLAAYNAGEGTVSGWLSDKKYSDDGIHLKKIPYPETESYVKKVLKFKKIYDFYY